MLYVLNSFRYENSYKNLNCIITGLGGILAPGYHIPAIIYNDSEVCINNLCYFNMIILTLLSLCLIISTICEMRRRKNKVEWYIKLMLDSINKRMNIIFNFIVYQKSVN